MASDDKFTASGKEGDLVILLDTSSEPLPGEKGGNQLRASYEEDETTRWLYTHSRMNYNNWRRFRASGEEGELAGSSVPAVSLKRENILRCEK